MERKRKQHTAHRAALSKQHNRTTNSSSNSRGDAASVATTGVLKLKDADDFDAAVQAAIWAGGDEPGVPDDAGDVP